MTTTTTMMIVSLILKITHVFSASQVFKNGFMPIVEHSVEPDLLYDAHHEYGCGNRLSQSSCGEDSRCTWKINPELDYLAYMSWDLQKKSDESSTQGCLINGDDWTNWAGGLNCYGYNYTVLEGAGSSTRPSLMTDVDKQSSVFHITYNDGRSNWCQHNPDPYSIKFHSSSRSNDSNTMKNDDEFMTAACSNLILKVDNVSYNCCGNDMYEEYDQGRVAVRFSDSWQDLYDQRCRFCNVFSTYYWMSEVQRTDFLKSKLIPDATVSTDYEWVSHVNEPRRYGGWMGEWPMSDFDYLPIGKYRFYSPAVCVPKDCAAWLMPGCSPIPSFSEKVYSMNSEDWSNHQGGLNHNASEGLFCYNYWSWNYWSERSHDYTYADGVTDFSFDVDRHPWWIGSAQDASSLDSSDLIILRLECTSDITQNDCETLTTANSECSNFFFIRKKVDLKNVCSTSSYISYCYCLSAQDLLSEQPWVSWYNYSNDQIDNQESKLFCTSYPILHVAHTHIHTYTQVHSHMLSPIPPTP